MFLKIFEEKNGIPASYYNVKNLYPNNMQLNHWLAYDEEDPISVFSYLKEVLEANPTISAQKYEGIGHERMIKAPQVIEDLTGELNRILKTP